MKKRTALSIAGKIKKTLQLCRYQVLQSVSFKVLFTSFDFGLLSPLKFEGNGRISTPLNMKAGETFFGEDSPHRNWRVGLG